MGDTTETGFHVSLYNTKGWPSLLLFWAAVVARGSRTSVEPENTTDGL